MSVHNPVRPDWTCGGCGDPWPCTTRRQELTAEFAGASASLHAYLVSLLVAACQDLPLVPAGELHSRFVDWTAGGNHRADP